jgi:hypothetical protein
MVSSLYVDSHVFIIGTNWGTSLGPVLREGREEGEGREKGGRREVEGEGRGEESGKGGRYFGLPLQRRG